MRKCAKKGTGRTFSTADRRSTVLAPPSPREQRPALTPRHFLPHNHEPQPTQALPSHHAPICVSSYPTNQSQSSHKPPYTSTTWAGSLGLPTTPAKPLTAAASPRTARVVRAAGRVGTPFSHAWIGMIFWTELKMIRRRAGNVRRRLLSLRLLVRRLGYVRIAFARIYILVWEEWVLVGLGYIGPGCQQLEITLYADSIDCLGQILQGKARDGIQPRQDD